MRLDFSGEKPMESNRKIQGFVNSKFAVIRKTTKSLDRSKPQMSTTTRPFAERKH